MEKIRPKPISFDIDWDRIEKERELIESSGVWIDSKGRGKPISLMASSYILNTIKCLKGESPTGNNITEERGGLSNAEWIKIFQAELERRTLI